MAAKTEAYVDTSALIAFADRSETDFHLSLTGVALLIHQT
jgi:hypothetical protein